MSSSAGKAAVKVADSVVNLIIIIALLLMMALGCYSLWDSRQVFNEAASSNWTAYKPTDYPYNTLGFNELQALNPEVIGWVQVYGTDIDYPVAQATDNMKYVNCNAKGEFALSGCPFLDCTNKPDFSDFNSIIYGHHMDVPAMFGELDDFENADYFDSHKYGTLFYGGTLHGLEFFAFLSTDAYNSAVYNVAVQGESNQAAYLDNLYSTAKQSRDIGVSTEDNIVLLSTCSTDGTDGRFLVAARISDTVYDNPFAEQAEEGSTWSVWDYLRSVPWWAWLALLLLIAIIVIVLVRRMKDRRQSLEAMNDNEGMNEQLHSQKGR